MGVAEHDMTGYADGEQEMDLSERLDGGYKLGLHLTDEHLSEKTEVQ